MIFSHYHLDHVGGIVGVFHERSVDRVITGPLAEPASGVALVQGVLAQHGLAISTPPVGSQFDVGQVHLQVLAPQVAFHDTRSDPNNSSLVLRATVGDTSILLPGDVEVEAQQTMIAARIDVSADVLKVPHHGSAYFDPDFLAAVHARVGVISVGLHNDYGHPSPLLLTELAKIGVPVRRTDLDGDVAVVGPSARLTTVQRGTAASELAARGSVRHRRGAPTMVDGVLTARPRFTGFTQVSISGRSTPRDRAATDCVTSHRPPARSARSPPGVDHSIGRCAIPAG